MSQASTQSPGTVAHQHQQQQQHQLQQQQSDASAAILEMKRLRDRIKMLETDNASMHMKLSKTQQAVNQRLTDIEMQIAPGCDLDSATDEVFQASGHAEGAAAGSPDDAGDSGGDGCDNDNENNIESFI